MALNLNKNLKLYYSIKEALVGGTGIWVYPRICPHGYAANNQ